MGLYTAKRRRSSRARVAIVAPGEEVLREDVAGAGFLELEDINGVCSAFAADAVDAVCCYGSFEPWREREASGGQMDVDVVKKNEGRVMLQSKKLAAKLMHRLPSHVPLPFLFTKLGMS